jgi:hypothetical protein
LLHIVRIYVEANKAEETLLWDVIEVDRFALVLAAEDVVDTQPGPFVVQRGWLHVDKTGKLRRWPVLHVFKQYVNVLRASGLEGAVWRLIRQ